MDAVSAQAFSDIPSAPAITEARNQRDGPIRIASQKFFFTDDPGSVKPHTLTFRMYSIDEPGNRVAAQFCGFRYNFGMPHCSVNV